MVNIAPCITTCFFGWLCLGLKLLCLLHRQWHTWCFACGECGAVLAGEYMGRGGVPYCERDYQRLYGVRCAYCQRYISGKVLQVCMNLYFTARHNFIYSGDDLPFLLH